VWGRCRRQLGCSRATLKSSTATARELVPPRLAAQALVGLLTGFIFHVTAGHKHVGAAFENVKDPRYMGGKIRPGAEMADVQASVQAMSIALVTGFQQPLLMDDWTHLILHDNRYNETRHVLDSFQQELAALSERVDELNTLRRFKVNAFNPRIVASSVSI